MYLVYGMYDCLNVVSEPPGSPAAILIRAVEPLEGADAMRAARLATVRARRRLDEAALEAERERLDRLPDHVLARGPGLVAASFGIGRSLTGTDLLDPASPVRLEPAASEDPAPEPAWTPRIGIDYAGEVAVRRLWRLIDASSPSVSGPRPRPAR